MPAAPGEALRDGPRGATKLAVSTRMPPSLRSPAASASHRSLGHLSRRRAVWPPEGSMGCRLSATLTPTASDRPDPSLGASGSPRDRIQGAVGLAVRAVSAAPAVLSGPLCHVRPMRPRPAVCCSVTSSVGAHGPARARRMSSLLVESMLGSTWTVKPGNSGDSASRSASVGQPWLSCAGAVTGCGLVGVARQGPGPLRRGGGGGGWWGGGGVGGQQGAWAVGAAAPAGVLGLEPGGVALLDGQAVVVTEFFAGLDIAQRRDENAALALVGIAVRKATVVDPARGVAAELGVDHMLVIDVKIKGVPGLHGVMRVALLRRLPIDDLAGVLQQHVACGDVLHGKNALAMHARAPGLDAAAGAGAGGYGGRGAGRNMAGHGKNSVNLGMHACARVCARIRIVEAPGPCPDAQYDWRENHPHDQDPGNCRKAFGGAGHRARTDPRGRQVRQA